MHRQTYKETVRQIERDRQTTGQILDRQIGIKLDRQINRHIKKQKQVM